MNKPGSLFLSDNRRKFLDLKDNLKILEELRQLSPSKRRDELVQSISNEVGVDLDADLSARRAIITQLEADISQLSEKKKSIIAEIDEGLKYLEQLESDHLYDGSQVIRQTFIKKLREKLF